MKTVLPSFCSVESLKIDEPLAGTAAHPEKNLLLSWPRSKWSAHLKHAKNMSDSTKNLLDSIATAGRRVNLIDRKSQSQDIHRVLLLPERLVFDVSPDDLESLLEDIRSQEDLSRWNPEGQSNPVLICCTHGQKDKCCAKFGNATYQSIIAAPESVHFDIWESTHLGGCRLAASAMIFPTMRKYGRILPESVSDFLAAEMDGLAYLPSYRGNARLDALEQCVEIAALEWLTSNQETCQANVSIHCQSKTDSTAAYHVHIQNGEEHTLEVHCKLHEIIRFSTCKDMDSLPEPEPQWIWKVTSLKHLSAEISE